MTKYTKTSLIEDYSIRIVGFLISIFIFWIFDFFLNFRLNYIHYILFILICATGILLSPLYSKFRHYDKVLHFLSPFLFSFIVFFILDKNINTFLSIKLFLTFSITIFFITFMEVGEYIIDKLVGWELQGVYTRNRSGTVKLGMIQSRIDDAMQDILLGIAGSLLFVLTKLII